ncbi:MarR family winged helix-turn-helix transcriptional regulator [Georgenia thermotolerans]|uniref:Winged helix DNA-binding protein n=1 Tax=Georgenia thermotolerans TaxID=527326 RepID=A0A7J5USZ5_9MICO|nr:MarR family winged helix-turn-helix transcriptional regulator [Georgenia thermotolerans]KAE8765519.1 winged helix DNA-binding protein [Georgenia thermotolerans]
MTPPTKASPTLDDRASIELWGRVIQGFQATNRAIHGAIKAAFALNEAEAETLLNLHRHPEHRVPMAKLARAAAFTTGGFTKIADKLTRRGLVVRVPCADDRRVTFLELTPAGSDVAAELARLVADVNRSRVIDVLGPDRAALVAEAMTDLYRANRPPGR